MISNALRKGPPRAAALSLAVFFLFAGAPLFADTLPIISLPPQTVTVSPGSNVVLTVTASGAGSYQWRFNGDDAPGATNASLTITNAQLTNSGYYVAIAKNSLGWVPSLPAYLSVVDTPGLVPFSNKFYSNGIAVYLVTELNLDRRMVTNGTATIIAGPALDQMQPIPGVSQTVQNGFFGSLTPAVPNVAQGQTVYCRVSVGYPRFSPTGTNVSIVLKFTAGGGTNPVPSATNIYFPAWLEWPDYDPGFEDPPFRPYSTPTNQLRITGETFTLTNTFFGYLLDLGIPFWQWRKDGVKIGSPITLAIASGMTNSTLTFTNVQPSDAGIYDLEYKGNNWVIGPKTVLTVLVTNAQGIIQSPRKAGTNFVFDLLCAPRRKYLIQKSTNLVTWANVQTITNTLENDTATVSATNNLTDAVAAFYRSRLLP